MVSSRRIDLTSTGLTNALTIEVEERWDCDRSRKDVAPQAESGVRALLTLLAAAQTRATFFVLGAVAERHPHLAKDIAAAGHEIGCHGHLHRPVATLTPSEFRADLRQAINVLCDQTGSPLDTFRAPDFSIAPDCRWALDVLIEEGILFDNSIDATRHDRTGIMQTPLEPYTIQRAPGGLWELPPPVVRGLTSARLDLYPLLRCGFHASNCARRPFVISMHSWEFVGQRGARATERLERFLTDFRFGALSDTLARWCEEKDGGPRRLAA